MKGNKKLIALGVVVLAIAGGYGFGLADGRISVIQVKNVMSEESPMLKQAKPYLTLALDIRGCDFFVQINGVSVLEEISGQPLKMELPVNAWLRSGENTVAIKVYYMKNDILGKHAEVSATLRLRTKRDSASIPLNRLQFQGGAGTAGSTPEGTYKLAEELRLDSRGEIRIEKPMTIPNVNDAPGLLVSQTVTLPLNLPLWAFFESHLIYPVPPDQMSPEEDDKRAEALTQELFVIYKNIYEALVRRDVDSILPLFSERSNELEQAYDLPAGKVTLDLRAALQSAVQNPKKEIVDFSLKTVQFDLAPNRKLARLVRPDRGKVIVFNDKDGSSHESFDLVFRKSGARWIITR